MEAWGLKAGRPMLSVFGEVEQSQTQGEVSRLDRKSCREARQSLVWVTQNVIEIYDSPCWIKILLLTRGPTHEILQE